MVVGVHFYTQRFGFIPSEGTVFKTVRGAYQGTGNSERGRDSDTNYALTSSLGILRY